MNIAEINRTYIQPNSLESEYIFNGLSVGDIYGLAGSIIRELDSLDENEPVCICTENKAFIMASLVASLVTGRQLIFPYSFSIQVLEEAKKYMPYTYAIVDDTVPTIPGIKSILPFIDERAAIPNELAIHDNEPFIYLFTGGSTGTPKLWSKTPVNLFSEAMYISETFKISEKDVILSTVPPYHIYGLLFSVLVPFISHASVLEGIYTFPQEICTMIKESSASVLTSVPMHYRILKGCDFNGHSMRLAFSSAGALDAADAVVFSEITGVGIHEIYGSTETGGIAVRCRALGEESYKPFKGVACKIDNEKLYVKSDFISKELPRDTDDYFVTGDRVRKSDADRFELLGRSDGVVKVAGKRVDLGDIQAKLKKIDGISDVYVFSMKGKLGRENEIAALVQGEINESDIRKRAGDILEPYAVPRKIKIVSRIPLLSTGKYDRKSIQAMFANGGTQ